MEMNAPRVLELITTPMDFNGQPLFPLRMAGRMTDVRPDFLTYYVADERIREAVEAMGGTLHVAPSRLRHPVKYIRFVSRLVREQKYDVVHAHGNSCTLAIDLLAARLGGAKVRIAHSHNSHCKFTLLHRLLRLPFNALYTHAMACGEEAGRWLFGRRGYTVIHNAVDAGGFAFHADDRAAVREEFGVGGDTVIGCVASLTPVKNHAFLLDVFSRILARNPDCRLVLVGDGPLRAELESRARELEISDRVTFTGVRTDVPRLLQMMDVMLLPSLFEGFPTVALEWQCAGLPVVMSENITSDCAFTDAVCFLAFDPDAWADAVMKLPEIDRAALSREGAAAIARAGYDLSTAAASLEADYRRFASEK